jgi:hypothetical protein
MVFNGDREAGVEPAKRKSRRRSKAELQQKRRDWVELKVVKHQASTNSTTRLLTWVNQVMFDLELIPAVQVLAWHVCQHLNSDTGDLFPSEQWLATIMNVSERWVVKLVKALEGRGHIRVERKTGRHNNYELVWKEPADILAEPVNGSAPVNGSTPVNGSSHASEREFTTPVNGSSPTPEREFTYAGTGVHPNYQTSNHQTNDQKNPSNGLSERAAGDDEVEGRQDQSDASACSDASASSPEPVGSFICRDDRPSDRSDPPSREDLTEQPDSADVMKMFGGLADAADWDRQRSRIRNITRAV